VVGKNRLVITESDGAMSRCKPRRPPKTIKDISLVVSRGKRGKRGADSERRMLERDRMNNRHKTNIIGPGAASRVRSKKL